ncbi:MAG: zinc-binding dehydrogenase [Rickettsiales bacterium]
MKATVFMTTGQGGPRLEYTDVPGPKRPGPGEILVRHTAIGAGFFAIDACRGLRAAPPPPFIPGIEAAGVVEMAGEGSNFSPGDRVAYGTARFGAYAEMRTMPAALAVGIPDGVPDEIAAAVISKGMVAHMALCRVFSVKKEHRIFVHAAAGGVGHIISQWASNAIGATVLGCVGAEDKIPTAEKSGCNAMTVGAQNVEEFVARFTDGEGVDVVYDGVGGTQSLGISVAAARPFGLIASLGQSAGEIPPVNVRLFDKKNLYFTRPVLQRYKSDRRELTLTAVELFTLVERNKIRPVVDSVMPLSAAATAHKKLLARANKGVILLRP